eukprot:Sspe_Gene.26083::Locus_10655_Transcript_1_1_Confidence_1.000_Length_1658::g.26083::m.26083
MSFPRWRHPLLSGNVEGAAWEEWNVLDFWASSARCLLGPSGPPRVQPVSIPRVRTHIRVDRQSGKLSSPFPRRTFLGTPPRLPSLRCSPVSFHFGITRQRHRLSAVHIRALHHVLRAGQLDTFSRPPPQLTRPLMICVTLFNTPFHITPLDFGVGPGFVSSSLLLTPNLLHLCHSLHLFSVSPFPFLLFCLSFLFHCFLHLDASFSCRSLTLSLRDINPFASHLLSCPAFTLVTTAFPLPPDLTTAFPLPPDLFIAFPLPLTVYFLHLFAFALHRLDPITAFPLHVDLYAFMVFPLYPIPTILLHVDVLHIDLFTTFPLFPAFLLLFSTFPLPFAAFLPLPSTFFLYLAVTTFLLLFSNFPLHCDPSTALDFFTICAPFLNFTFPFYLGPFTTAFPLHLCH